MLNIIRNKKSMDQSSLILIFLIKFSVIATYEYDISKGKSLNQSRPLSGFEAKYATDGDLNTHFKVSSYDASNVWIEIDLNGLYYIYKVMLWTTDDEGYYLARNLMIYIQYKKDYHYFHDNTEVQLTKFEYSISQGINSDSNKAFSFNYTTLEGTYGKYVWIGKNSEDLYLAEIVVLTKSSNVGIIDINQISQNHDYSYGFFASRAIDGDESTFSLTAQANASLRNITGWLKIDLGINYIIHEIQIYDSSEFMNDFSGYYKVYVDSSIKPTNLCFTYNQSSPQNKQYYKITCATFMTGRYVTFVKYANPRIDALLFCEIRVFTTHSAKEFIYPRNYNSIITSTPMFNDTYLQEEAKISLCKQNQMIIGIVVGLLGVIIGIFITIMLQYLMKKRLINQNVNNVVIYEKPNTIDADSHVYEDLNNNSSL